MFNRLNSSRGKNIQQCFTQQNLSSALCYLHDCTSNLVLAIASPVYCAKVKHFHFLTVGGNEVTMITVPIS